MVRHQQPAFRNGVFMDRWHSYAKLMENQILPRTRQTRDTKSAFSEHRFSSQKKSAILREGNGFFA